MMAPQQKAPRQPQDPYAQRGKKLASAVQRLRGWVGSDPSRNVELADALVELNAHRLLGHDYAAAGPDAQDALRRSAELFTAKGPIGPYTSVNDAVRYLTAVVHLAVTQAGLGLPEAAGRTIASIEDVKEQLRELPLEERLDPMTAIWALSCSARSALAAGNVGAANAYTDAALARLAESGLRADPDSGYLVIDTHRLASDSRWAAGRPEESLAFLHQAKERYDQVVDGRLREAAGLSPALLNRLAEPLFGLYRDMADRLVASGEVDLGLVTRRELVTLLRGLVGRLGQSARVQLASTLTDLADDLLKSERVEEADASTSEAAETMPDSPAAGSTRLLAASIRARVLTRTGRGAEAVPMLRKVISGESSDSLSAARALALLALGDALRTAEDAESAAGADQEADQLARRLLGASLVRDDMRSALRDAARGAVSRGILREGWEPLPASASYSGTTASTVRSVGAETAATRPGREETAAWLEAERAEAHRLELERLERARVDAARREAEQAEAERAATARLAEERARAERAKREEAERRAAAEAAERLERKRRREERLEEHRLEVERRDAERREAERLEAERQAGGISEPDAAEAERRELERIEIELAELERAEDRVRTEAERAAVEREAARAEAEHAEAGQAEQSGPEAAEEDELAIALGEWRETKARGDRRGARAANERVVDLLRPRAQTDVATYGPQLLDALDELSRARLRSGDVWGSRAPAKEAKALAKTLNR